MARYRGPQSRISRKFGEPIFGPDKVLERKNYRPCLLYTSPSPRDRTRSRMPSSA